MTDVISFICFLLWQVTMSAIKKNLPLKELVLVKFDLIAVQTYINLIFKDLLFARS